MRNLSYYDKSHCTVGHYCAPVNIGNFHWVVLDVVLRNREFENGCVWITNHIHKTEDDELLENLVQNTNHSSYYAQMWAAKYFGIYNMDSNGVNPSQIYFGYGDMHVKQFHKKNRDVKQPFSTLDHSSNNNPNSGIQHDGYNCRIWALMEICNRKYGSNEPIGIKTTAELKNYRLPLFTLMINIYEITQKTHENSWLFEWKENKVKKILSSGRNYSLNHLKLILITMVGGQSFKNISEPMMLRNNQISLYPKVNVNCLVKEMLSLYPKVNVNCLVQEMLKVV